jgi:hypothetical protein
VGLGVDPSAPVREISFHNWSTGLYHSAVDTGCAVEGVFGGRGGGVVRGRGAFGCGRGR